MKRRLSFAAGIAALLVAAGRFLAGSHELGSMMQQLRGRPEGTLLAIVWHGLTAVMAVLGLALVVTAWTGRGAAKASGWIACGSFGAIAAIMALFAGERLGNPLQFYPVYLLAGVAILSGFAARRA